MATQFPRGCDLSLGTGGIPSAKVLRAVIPGWKLGNLYPGRMGFSSHVHVQVQIHMCTCT